MAIEKIALGVASAAMSAVGQIQAGREQARAQRSQARISELRGRQSALQYQQQGVEVLRRTRQNISTVTARAAAGGLDPYSGTPDSLKMYAQSAGAEDFYLTRENAQLAEITGETNAAQYRSAAAQTQRQGYINAIGTVGQAAFTLESIGGTETPGVNAAQSQTTYAQQQNMSFLGP